MTVHRHLVDILAGVTVLASWWGDHVAVIGTTLAVAWYATNLVTTWKGRKTPK